MLPALAGSSPLMRLKQVVLPAPLGPIQADDLARGHRKGDVGQGANAPKNLLKPSTSSMSNTWGEKAKRVKGEKGKTIKSHYYPRIASWSPAF